MADLREAYLFVDPKAAEEFQCCICIELFKQAVQVCSTRRISECCSEPNDQYDITLKSYDLHCVAPGHVFCWKCISRYQAERDMFPCPTCRTLCDSNSMGKVPFIDRQVKNLKVACPNSILTPERAEYLNRRKRGHSAKVDSETSNSLGEQQEKEQDGVNEENHENENPVMDEAKPCGPMRIQRKRRLTELSDFRANKRHKTSGGGTCEWIGALMDLELHTKSCPYQLTQCIFCRMKVENWELGEHHQVCGEYPVECGSCKQTGIPRSQMTIHRERDCPATIVRCHSCDNTYRRSDLSSHLRYKCPEQDVPCLLEEFGCNEEVKRKDQVKHIEERVVDHLGIIVSAMKAQKEKLAQQEQHIQDLRQEIGILKSIPMIQQAMSAGNGPGRSNRNDIFAAFQRFDSNFV